MPHLHIKHFKTPQFPCEHAGVRFDHIATNTAHADEHLIATTVEGKAFFLLVKEGKEETLLKSDKISRPSGSHYVHQALLAYAAVSDCEITGSNVPENSKNIHLVSDSALKGIDFFSDDFPKDREVHIEVGFGSGRHLLHQAKADPNVLFIGIEIHKPSIEQVLKQINIQQIRNLYLLDYDARLFMEFVPSNLVGRIYVHFPVPWDKKPHRRVISEAFVNEAIRVLKVDGRLELRTDSENYFQFALQTFTSLNRLRLEILKNLDIAISSKYEDRWKRLKKNIYDVTMTCEEESQPIDLDGDLSFEEKSSDLEQMRELNGKTERFEGGFIHFERLYTVEETRLLFRLSMGSYDRPEHLYLYIEDNTMHYFPAPPVRSRINLMAHDHLRKLLYG